MTREPSFPYDWIEPGEYHYCHKCGMLLVLPQNPICGICKLPPLQPIPKSEPEDAAPELYKLAMQKVDEIRNLIHKPGYADNALAPTADRKDSSDAAVKMHKFLEGERRELAQRRIDNGMKPWFWMAKENASSSFRQSTPDCSS